MDSFVHVISTKQTVLVQNKQYSYKTYKSFRPCHIYKPNNTCTKDINSSIPVVSAKQTYKTHQYVYVVYTKQTILIVLSMSYLKNKQYALFCPCRIYKTNNTHRFVHVSKKQTILIVLSVSYLQNKQYSLFRPCHIYKTNNTHRFVHVISTKQTIRIVLSMSYLQNKQYSSFCPCIYKTNNTHCFIHVVSTKQTILIVLSMSYNMKQTIHAQNKLIFLSTTSTTGIIKKYMESIRRIETVKRHHTSALNK